MLNRSKILVVDDELGTRESLRILLEGSYQVKTAQRGKEALELMVAEAPDMVLLDIMMPEMGGIEVLRRIKEKSTEVPVAIVTAYASLENTQEALRLGAVDYLIKPFDRADVEKVVEKGLSHRRKHLHTQQVIEDVQRQIGTIEQEKETLQREVTLTREYLECLLESSPDAIASTDTQGRFAFCNRGVEALYGYRAEELIGTPLDRYYAGGQEEARRIGGLLKKNSRLLGYEATVLHKKGHPVPSLLSVSLIRDKEGKVIGTLGILRDITEQKRLQEQIIQTEKLRALGEMAAGIAHDFNNLLTIILTRVQLLRLKMAPLESQAIGKDLQAIERAATDGAETVRRIRELTRVQAVERSLEPVDINSLIRDVVELTRPRWYYEAQSKGIHVDCHLNLEEVPLVTGNPAELREVLTNLVFNALEAMPHGGVLSLSTGPAGAPGWVEVRIQDSGVGIPPEVLRRIFDPFFSTKGPQNSGLGLSVSYGIIASYGGTIEVESQQEEGSTFTIRLRASEAL